MTLRTRLAVLVAVSVGLAVVALALVATVTTRNVLRDGVDRALGRLSTSSATEEVSA